MLSYNRKRKSQWVPRGLWWSSVLQNVRHFLCLYKIFIVNLSSGSWKQFGVASFAQVSCNGNTGWWSPIAVKDWIAKNSNFKGVTSSRSSSSSSPATKQSSSPRPNTSLPVQQSFKRPQNYKPRPNYSRPSYSPPQSSYG